MSSCPLTWASGPAHNSAQIACARPPLGTGHRCGRVPQKFTPALRLPDGGGVQGRDTQGRAWSSGGHSAPQPAICPVTPPARAPGALTNSPAARPRVGDRQPQKRMKNSVCSTRISSWGSAERGVLRLAFSFRTAGCLLRARRLPRISNFRLGSVHIKQGSPNRACHGGAPVPVAGPSVQGCWDSSQ